MADSFVQGCFSFACSAQEWSLLQEGFLLSLDLGGGRETEPRSAAFMSLFPSDGEDRWSEFRALFDDREFPDFGADLAGGACADGRGWEAIISAEVSFEPVAVARLIQRCCAATLASGPIGFEWAVTCSRQRADEFGGGWCAIFRDDIAFETTGQALALALSPRRREPRDGLQVWVEDPDHPIADWQYEVANFDTQLGYVQWVTMRSEVLDQAG